MHAQVVISSPIFAHQASTVTLTYDASKGNQALKGFTGTVYAHAGLITTASTSATDWKFVQGTWGTADAKVKMTASGTDKYRITIDIATFYGFPAGTNVLKLAFVFRNADGSIVGRDDDGSDIYYDIYPNDNQLRAKFFEPKLKTLIINQGQTLNLFGAASTSSTLTITDNGTIIAQANDVTLAHTLTFNTPGTHLIILKALIGGGVDAQDTLKCTVPIAAVTEDPPLGTVLGATEIASGSLRFMLHAPNKSNVYLLGSFNNYTIDPTYSMKRSIDGQKWWIDVQNLTPGQNYTYQYLVDGTIKIADPLSELILDPSNDAAISSSVFPNMPAYPTGKTTSHVSVITPGKVPYNWQISNFTPPAKTDMIVYELLMRDFLADHSYKSLKDTLDYLNRLGVNVIELMPVSEFENNNSWGYNVSYHMALDKYYGSPERFKAFVDAAHQRGMAVVLDVVYNHAFGQSPLAALYWDSANNRPAANNPWLNPIPKHPYNVGNDFNHESLATKDYVIRSLKYWLTEFHVDGFRFDLSKGFTQKQSSDDGAFAAYDQSRIDILKGYADAIWATNPGATVILEHFATNSEETVLANYGMMLWGNMNGSYNEASMGYNGAAISGVSHKSRNWTVPHLVGYMESHDEERLMYKNLNFGNSSGSYSVKNLETALARQELVNAFFLTVPGPKMIWQFGELGYDFSINTCTNGTVNNNCRLDPKPIRWNYLNVPERKHLYDVVSAINHLRTTQQVFKVGTYNVVELSAANVKAFHLSSTDLNVVVLGNFGVIGTTVNPGFQHTGTWYNYLSGDSLSVTMSAQILSFLPGEYRIYTDKRIGLPTGNGLITNATEPLVAIEAPILFPNPSADKVSLSFRLRQTSTLRISLFDLTGRLVEQGSGAAFAEGQHIINLPFKAPKLGFYFVEVKDQYGNSSVLKWLVE